MELKCCKLGFSSRQMTYLSKPRSAPSLKPPGSLGLRSQGKRRSTVRRANPILVETATACAATATAPAPTLLHSSSSSSCYYYYYNHDDDSCCYSHNHHHQQQEKHHHHHYRYYHVRFPLPLSLQFLPVFLLELQHSSSSTILIVVDADPH